MASLSTDNPSDSATVVSFDVDQGINSLEQLCKKLPGLEDVLQYLIGTPAQELDFAEVLDELVAEAIKKLNMSGEITLEVINLHSGIFAVHITAGANEHYLGFYTNYGYVAKRFMPYLCETVSTNTIES